MAVVARSRSSVSGKMFFIIVSYPSLHNCPFGFWTWITITSWRAFSALGVSPQDARCSEVSHDRGQPSPVCGTKIIFFRRSRLILSLSSLSLDLSLYGCPEGLRVGQGLTIGSQGLASSGRKMLPTRLSRGEKTVVPTIPSEALEFAEVTYIGKVEKLCLL